MGNKLYDVFTYFPPIISAEMQDILKYTHHKIVLDTEEDSAQK